MKQHITNAQLNELSDKGKEKLREWARNKNMVLMPQQEYLPLLSIGQMIEFMWEDNPTFVIPETTALCDALWEACKDVLK